MMRVKGLCDDEYPDPCDLEAPENRDRCQSVRNRNSRLLASVVEKIVLPYRGKVAEKDMPFMVFQDLLHALQGQWQQLDLTVYPPRDRCYAKYIVYNHKDNGAYPFSFTLIVLKPGQKTPKHSHRVDCAPICVLGEIEETLYQEVSPYRGTSPAPLRVLGKALYRPFEGGYLRTDQPNVHHLENHGSSLAMSLHLYVFDADPDENGRVGSSLLKVYP